MEATKYVSIVEWINKLWSYNPLEVLHSNKNEQTSATTS